MTILSAGSVIGVLSSVLYCSLYWFLYVQHSYIFSLIYLVPLLGSTMTLVFFKHKYVWKDFSYKSAFAMSFMTGLISALIFSLALFVAYSFFLEPRIELFNDIDNDKVRQMMSPVATSLSMFFTNVILSLFYSLIIAIFAKKKN